MQDIPQLAFTVTLELILIVLLAGTAASLVVMLKGFGVMRRNRLRGLARDDAAILLKSPLAPPIAVLAVAPDASEASRNFVHNLVKLHYGDHEVLLVLDGPSDQDLAAWVAEFRLFPSSRSSFGDIRTQPVRGVYESRDPIRLMVIEKEKGGVADCLNVGLNLAAAPLVALARAAAAALAQMPPLGWETLQELSRYGNPVAASAALEALERARKGVRGA